MNEVAIQGCPQNTSLNCSLHDEEQSRVSIPVILFALLNGILVLLFNSGILVLIVKKKKIRHNPYHFLIVMLCVSNIVVGLGISTSVFSRIIPAFKISKSVTILNTLLMTTGLYLPLYHTFLISLQRFLVICKEKWNSYIFCQNRKYFVSFGGSLTIMISNCVLISPSNNEFDNENMLLFVYNGHYTAYTIYIRFLTLFLLSATVILYLITIAHMYRSYKKISPTVDSNALRVIKSNAQTIEPCPSEKACTQPSAQDQVNVGAGRSRVEHANQMDSLRRKKVVSTLQLVGLLITVLLIFTGPLIVTLYWIDAVSPTIRCIIFGLFCMNSMLNPFIYVWKLVDIRGIVKSALCCFNR